jgi:hypothetical protein
MLPSGSQIEAKHKTTSSIYAYGTRRGLSIKEFEVPQHGTYTGGVPGALGILRPKGAVAIGGRASKAISVVIGKCILSLMGGIVVSALIFVRVALPRLESRRDIRGLPPV